MFVTGPGGQAESAAICPGPREEHRLLEANVVGKLILACSIKDETEAVQPPGHEVITYRSRIVE
jgi:hypothetical protein